MRLKLLLAVLLAMSGIVVGGVSEHELATICAYDAAAVTRVDVGVARGVEACPGPAGGSLELSGASADEARGASTTPSAAFVATEAVSHSPYQVHIDPISGEGPMGIDTTTFKSGATTANGGVRNSRAFWNEWQETYPGTLSETNQDLIASGRSPIVDEHWMQTFPETSVNEGETLVHHHPDCGPVAVPLPASVHGGTPGYSIWHSTC